MSKLLKTTLLALATTTAISGAAIAGDRGGIKDFSFSVQGGSAVGNPLTFVYVPKNGQYVFDRMEGSPVRMRLKAKKYRRATITEYKIYSTGRQVIADNGFQKGLWRVFDKTFEFKDHRSFKHDEAKGLRLCQQHGDPSRKKTIDLRMHFGAWMNSEGKNVRTPPGKFEKQAAGQYYNAKVVCMPEPFEVTDVDLTVKRKGSPISCPAEVTLTAKFKANKAGKFSFRLYRGDGAFRDVTQTIGNTGVGTYKHTYTFKQKTNRKYLVVVLDNTKVVSPWVPMVVNCSSNSGGGLSTGPRPQDHN